MSVMTQSYGSVPSPVKNSSADANPRAPYPSEDSASTSATRNDSSSSMIAIKGSLDTSYHPYSLVRGGARNGKSCHIGCTREIIQQYHCRCLRRPCLLGFDQLGHPDEVS